MKYFIFKKSIYGVAALLESMSWTRHKWSLSSWCSNSPAAAAKSLSCVRLCATSWTVAHQAPLSVGFSRQNTGAGCHFLLQEISLTQGLNLYLLCLLHWHVGSLPLVPTGKLPLNQSIHGASAFLSVKWRDARLSLMVRMQLYLKASDDPQVPAKISLPRIPPRKVVDLECLRSRR